MLHIQEETRQAMSLPIQVVDQNDHPIGSTTKQEAWAKGHIHRIVRIMLEDGRGNVLLQHRDPAKDIFPNCWDNSSTGHVNVGEDYDEAAIRELHEELGLKDIPLTVVGTYRSDEDWEGHRLNRFTRCYKATISTTPTPQEPGKIDGVKWFSIDEARTLVREHPEQVSDGVRPVLEKYYL
jgi:isopentenyl-diphosphate delta-isomerase type 1